MDHELVKLSQMLDWVRIAEVVGARFEERSGRPAKSTRLVVGILILQYRHKLSLREAVKSWVENPYWQYFCGMEVLMTEAPVHFTLLSKWTQQLEPEQLEALLQVTVETAKAAG